MIPLRMDIKNFLSYGEKIQTIDFKDYRLICFSGKNGSGKSALLDAITWGIWGQARKVIGVAKADEGLLRLGQTQMMVSIQFEFNKNVYRIRREFAKTYGRNRTVLDFELFNPSSRRFVSLSEKTVKKTQEKIEHLLGLDFETFSNSAFLRQGQANEFSQKNPRERKQILGNILGLSRYDELRQKALEYAKKYGEGKGRISNFIEQANGEIEKEKQFLGVLTLSKRDLERINFKIDGLQKKEEEIEKQHLASLAKEQQLMLLEKELKKLQSQRNMKTKEFQDLVGKWRDVHKKKLRFPDISKLEGEKNSLLERERNFREQQKQNLSLQGELLDLQEKYKKRFDEIRCEHEKKTYENKLTLDKNNLDLKNAIFIINQKGMRRKEIEVKIALRVDELKEIGKKLKEGVKLKEDYFSSQQQFEKRRTFFQVLVQRGNWIKSALGGIGRKMQVMRNEESPACPLCEQLLTVKRKRFLSQKFSKDEKFYKHRLLRITFLLKNLKEVLLKQNREMKDFERKDSVYKELKLRLEQLVKSSTEMEGELDILKKEIASLNKQKKKLQKVTCNLLYEAEKKEKELPLQIEKDKTLLNISEKVGKARLKKKNLSYEKEKHYLLSKKLEKTEKMLLELDFLRQELLLQVERQGKCGEVAKVIKEQKKSIIMLKERVKSLIQDLSLKQKLLQEIEWIKNEMALLGREKEKVLQNIGSLESNLKRIEHFKNENKDREKQLKNLEKEINDYQKLGMVFGKDGIQALLIEETIPEIEDEANSILSRLTDNGAQIFIESLRDLKRGGAKETLDIKISDVVGIRPYEMFSGGEAFRIDFSLRIAISKLLARRAGTALQTLIIDEGFGSQDDDGLSRLMDAIYTIQNDFSKVIVVSHLPIFKDNFPVHFVVEKMPTGSIVNVVERS